MSGAGRKLAVVFGLLAFTVVISGVAVAEPGQEEAAGPEARASVEEGGARATSSAGDQYSVDGGETPSRGEAEATVESGGGDPSGDGAVTRDRKQERRDQTRIEETEAREDARQNVSRERAREASPRQNEQRQNERQGVSRESESSPEARASAGARAEADVRKVQSPEIRNRVRELREQQRAGELRPAATGQNEDRRQRELRIAREKIVAEPVDEASLRRYKKLYEEAAEEYGFGDDWYVLAAVGKVESDHGQNLGPSSAGALGPMQFMPSTWASYGLDANGDGEANIMDPEDAIPSAARYLKVGGAPEDWYRALYTYNHAGWYVEKVLRVAERYRLAAGDEEAGPYYPDENR